MSSTTSETDDGLRVPDMVAGHLFGSYAIQAALELGLPDALGEEPVRIDVLARRVDADVDALRRLLRTLSSVGVFELREDGSYAHTPESEMLSSAAPFGRLVGALQCREWFRTTWSSLAEAVRTGRSPFAELHGKDFFDLLAEDDPETADAFHAGMTANHEPADEAVAAALDLRWATTLVDVGGGQGSLLRALLRANEHLHGVLFDRSSTLTGVFDGLRAGPLAQRCDVIAGDAFEAVPAGADVYLLRAVLHDWPDDDCVRLLSRCAEAAKPGSRIIAVERLLPPERSLSALLAAYDLHMLLFFGGRERTEPEFAELFRRAGLTYSGAEPTASEFHLIESTR